MVLQLKNQRSEKSVSIISFGSNLSSDFGVSAELIDGALSALSRNGLFRVEVSGFYQTPAFPKESGPDFINGVVRGETALSAVEVLAVLHGIEAEFGRTRNKRWEARALDLDLIDFGGQVAPDLDVHTKWRDLPLEDQMKHAPEQLILPHPRVQDRPFVLVPLCDVAPNWVHPITGVSVTEMLARFSGDALDEIRPYKR
ncbi:MAG: 2-amino-4-hydroxy-6-hydroxymethyldihydropteridine diphosphokinase [Amylibacter sp.]